MAVTSALARGHPAPAPVGALPPPDGAGEMVLERALARRRSVRAFRPEPLTERALSRLLWAAQGVVRPDGGRTAPSAGALYPLEIFVATAAGFFRYEPARHALERRAVDDLRAVMQWAAQGQEAVGSAPAVFVIAALPARTAARYGESRAWRYVALEAGHAAQNLLLEATALGLGAVPVGAFDEPRVREVLDLAADRTVLYLIPVGVAAD